MITLVVCFGNKSNSYTGVVDTSKIVTFNYFMSRHFGLINPYPI